MITSARIKELKFKKQRSINFSLLNNLRQQRVSIDHLKLYFGGLFKPFHLTLPNFKSFILPLYSSTSYISLFFWKSFHFVFPNYFTFYISYVTYFFYTFANFILYSYILLPIIIFPMFDLPLIPSNKVI